MDNIAVSQVIALGNCAVDLFKGDEDYFDVAADIGYTAYLFGAFTGGNEQSDLQIADKIIGGDTDKVIIGYNTDAFPNDLYEEIIAWF